MTRVKRGVMAHKRRKNLLKRVKGFENGRKNKHNQAKEALMHAGAYAYRDRRNKKRTMRALWLTRLSAAVKGYDLSYSKFIGAIKSAGIDLDRKILSDLAMNNPEIFAKIVEKIKATTK